MIRRFLFFLALLAAAVQPAVRATDGSGGLVRIDAIAADARGRLVQDLTAEDFEILEQGTPRRIESVQFVRLDGKRQGADPPPILSGAVERMEAERDGARLFAFFLDEYHVSAGPAVERVRTALTEFVERHIGPRDLVLIVKPLDSLPNLSLTRDRAVIREAIAAFDGRKGDYAPRNAFEQNFMATAPPRIEAVRTQISLSALNAIALYLGPLTNGRKTIIMVSEGLTQGPRRRDDAGLPTVETIIRSANRSSASIYPIDPRALLSPTPAADSTEPSEADALNTLRALAKDTDGQAILASSELNAGIERIISDSSGYYLIAFQPAHAEETGRFHLVDVRVKRPGVALRTRAGYWEPPPDATAILRKAAEPRPSMARHASSLIRPWFGMTRGEGGKTRVQFVWEAAVRVPGDRTRTAAPTRLMLNVLDTQGTVLFESVVVATNQSARAASPGSLAHAVFEVPPGRVELRMRIEDDTAKLLDTDVRDLIVVPMGGAVALGTAQVYRARNALEFRALENDPAAPPVVARQFSRTERLLIRVPAFALEGTPVVTARLVSGMGQVMRDLPVTSTSDSDLNIIDVPLSGLAAGEYRIELVATRGTARAQDSLTFRVTP